MSDLLHIICPNCLARNRVPAVRLGEGGKCGKCQTPLFNAKPVRVSAAGLEAMIAGNDIPVVVDFWAPWCGPCKMFAPVYAQSASDLEPHFRLLKCDTEAETQAATRYQIRSIPTLMLFHRGREVARQAGAMPHDAFVRWVKSAAGIAERRRA